MELGMEFKEIVKSMLRRIDGNWMPEKEKKILDEIERYCSPENVNGIGDSLPEDLTPNTRKKHMRDTLGLIRVPWKTVNTLPNKLWELNLPLWMKFDMMRILSTIDESWGQIFIDEFGKKYFKALWHFIATESEYETIYPQMHQIFGAFSYCPKKIKVVIVGQDPYFNKAHGPHAHGLCFSVKGEVEDLPPSLSNIFKELKNEGFHQRSKGDLTDWAKQGVLLLNTILTVRNGEPGSHSSFRWQLFTDRVIEVVNSKCTNVVFMLWGEKAKKKKKFITDPNHRVLEASHPSQTSVKKFYGCWHFLKANLFLKAVERSPIDWSGGGMITKAYSPPSISIPGLEDVSFSHTFAGGLTFSYNSEAGLTFSYNTQADLTFSYTYPAMLPDAPPFYSLPCGYCTDDNLKGVSYSYTLPEGLSISCGPNELTYTLLGGLSFRCKFPNTQQSYFYDLPGKLCICYRFPNMSYSYTTTSDDLLYSETISDCLFISQECLSSDYYTLPAGSSQLN